MKNFRKTLIIISLTSLFIIAIGCQEKQLGDTQGNNSIDTGTFSADENSTVPTISTKPPRIIKTADEVKPGQLNGPMIKFEKTVYDFGIVGPKSSTTCEFKFKNTGNETLKIPRTMSTCGCTIARLDKKEFAPGESGDIKVTYRADKLPTKVMKSITVFTNVPKRKSIKLTIKGEVQIPIAFAPNPLELKLDQENGAAGPITIQAKDDKPFAITSFTSSESVVSADIDNTKKAVKHTINPKVDVNKLENSLNGEISININHPVTKEVKLRYSAKPWFRLSTPRITVLNTTPGKTEIRDVMVLSNYGKKVEIESVVSSKKHVKVISQEQRDNAVKLIVQVTAPPKKTKSDYGFYDYLTVNVKGGHKLTLVASGTFRPKMPDIRSAAKTSK